MVWDHEGNTFEAMLANASIHHKNWSIFGPAAVRAVLRGMYQVNTSKLLSFKDLMRKVRLV